MKIAFSPIESKSNKYLELMIKSIRMNGIEVNKVKKTLKHIKLFKETKIYHFNWYENLSSKSYIGLLVEYLMKIFIIKFLKICNKKIVWTLHNKVQHQSKIDLLSISIMKFMVKNSDRIVIHSHESEEVITNLMGNPKYVKKTFYIEHPNYINVYPNNGENQRKKLGIEESELAFLFFGQIRPYKSIELMIKVFKNMENNNIKLILAGSPENEKYKEKLLNEIDDDPKIITMFKFVDDELVSSLLNTCDVVILPYDLKSSLNSGTIFLAFSNKKTVISTNNGTMKDLKDMNFHFAYEYRENKTHYIALKEEVEKAYSCFCEDSQTIKNMGNEAYEYVLKNNNLKKISKRFNDLYTSVLKD